MLRKTGNVNAISERGWRSFAAAAACLLMLALEGAPARAEIQVEAQLDRTTIALGDQVNLTVSIQGSGDADRPELPDLPDFRVFPAGTSRNFSFVNGRMTSATVHSFILSPKREGTFEIPPIAVVDGGTRVTSRALTLTVGPPAPAPPAGARRLPVVAPRRAPAAAAVHGRAIRAQSSSPPPRIR